MVKDDLLITCTNCGHDTIEYDGMLGRCKLCGKIREVDTDVIAYNEYVRFVNKHNLHNLQHFEILNNSNHYQTTIPYIIDDLGWHRRIGYAIVQNIQKIVKKMVKENDIVRMV